MGKKAESSGLEHPLAEVFGFPIVNTTKDAKRFRRNKLCPFNNKVPSCTKDKARNPLGVCSIFSERMPVVTCPVRFREGWIIVERASEFFFKEGTSWTSIAEVRLVDKNGKSAGNIDIVLVAYDERGHIVDFGSLEIQAVYISGNIRAPFEAYMKSPGNARRFNWKGKPNYPKPDYLSSSRKRLIPQVLYKGGILKAWGKKQAVALQSRFFETLPEMPRVEREEADIAWFLYDLKQERNSCKYHLISEEIVYTKFEPALERIVNPRPGKVEDFVETLQQKLDEKLDGNPPDTVALSDTILH
ncbi:MAG: NotI family restriction endonuclease [Planctomycetota bacterium]|nr:NotI family restriction endonuclease [Planctomycetota bacterium]